MTFPAHPPIDPEVIAIASTLEQAGYETWCVGGALRDLLLGDTGSDTDLATAAPPEVVQRLFRRTVPVGIEFGTVGVLDSHRRLHEVTTFRRDVSTDGRRAVVAYGVSLEDDLARRDFTINAIAWHPLRREWRDPFDGGGDLARRIVRAVGEPALRFREDYLRILRAIRFAARFDFTIDPATWEAACAEVGGLRDLSAERVRDEWFKGLRTARSVARLADLWRVSGAAAIWLPELAEEYPGAVEAPEDRDPVVLTGLLCRNPGEVLERLRASNHEVARARACDAEPTEPPECSALAVRRWLAMVGDAADDLRLLARYRLGADPPWGRDLDGVRARGEATSRRELAITGHDLGQAGVSPGPAMGRLLDALLERVLEDPSLNTKERLLALVREGAG